MAMKFMTDFNAQKDVFCPSASERSHMGLGIEASEVAEYLLELATALLSLAFYAQHSGPS